MRALTVHGPLDVRCTEVPAPRPPGAAGAVIRVTAAGICGSDLHIYDGHGFSADTGYCLGHEAVGEVIETGPEVRRFPVGARVLLPASVGCSACAPCAVGHVVACDHRRSRDGALCYGLSNRLPGSQAEAVGVPDADVNLVEVPDAISDEAAVLLTDNAPTAWYGCRRARIEPGDTVAVIGLGPVGQIAVRAALLLGAARVLVADPVESRCRQAEASGGTRLDPVEPAKHLRELTRGEGADAVIEAVGSDAAIGLAVRVARQAGRISVLGVTHNDEFPYPMAKAQARELEFAIGLCSVQRELPALLRLCATGRLELADLVTHRLDLSEGGRAYAMLAARDPGVGKILLDPVAS